jgi:hypothetical protein
MFQVLFGRHSPLIRILEVSGLILVGLIVFFKSAAVLYSPALVLLFSIMIAQYIFLRFCHLYNWYKKDRTHFDDPPRYLGIEVHFLKAMVPSSYVFFFANLLLFLGFSYFSMLTANLFLAAIVLLNGLLIFYHIKDDDSLPVNYFTQNLHEREKTE